MIQHLQQFERSAWSKTNSADPIVLCAADENYVKPLAVMLHSAASQLQPGTRLNVILMDGGLSESSWLGLKETFVDVPINVHVVRPDVEMVSDLAISHHITHTAYFRLLAAKLLPDSIDKVIYLDSDVLVQDDLCELWNVDLENQYCLAVPDIACPFIDARFADSNFKKSSPYLASLSPIRNWRALSLDPSARYFNSGVMILNVARWRDEQIEQQLLSCLRENEKFAWCWDQYALNVVFAGEWGELPLRWNQGAHIFEFPSVEHSPVSSDQFYEMRENPAIIHYTTEWKPWHYRPFHPLRHLFYDNLDKTAWSGWRPERPNFRIGDWWTDTAVGITKRATISYRRIANFWN